MSFIETDSPLFESGFNHQSYHFRALNTYTSSAQCLKMMLSIQREKPKDIFLL